MNKAINKIKILVKNARRIHLARSLMRKFKSKDIFWELYKNKINGDELITFSWYFSTLIVFYKVILQSIQLIFRSKAVVTETEVYRVRGTGCFWLLEGLAELRNQDELWGCYCTQFFLWMKLKRHRLVKNQGDAQSLRSALLGLYTSLKIIFHIRVKSFELKQHPLLNIWLQYFLQAFLSYLAK